MSQKLPLFLSALMAASLLSFGGPTAAAAGAHAPRSRLPLELYEKVPVPGHPGRIDHFTGNGRLLYFSIVGSNGVGVENWFDGTLIHFIPGVPAPQGEMYAPGFDELFSASSEGKVYIFDAKTYRLKKTLDFGADADDEVWDPVHHVVLVGFGEDDGGVAAIDPATNKTVGKVLRTGGHPERFDIELHGPMMYVNCPDAGMVVEAVNRDTGQLTRWSLPGGLRGNFAMALDEAGHRLFTITRKIPMLIVLDTQTGRVVSLVPGIVGEADDAFYDAARKRIYIIGGQGFVSVVQQITPERYALIANVATKVGARTGYWKAHMDRLYVGVQAEGGSPAQIMGFEAQDY